MQAVGYGWLLVMVLTVLGLRSPGEWVSGPCSTSSSCTASAPGLTQTLVTWDFSATLAAHSQRCFHRHMEYPKLEGTHKDPGTLGAMQTLDVIAELLRGAVPLQLTLLSVSGL